jgi:hypothetical protein
VLLALHDSGIGGHNDISATYNKIKALIAWPRMKQDVVAYVSKCQVCQKAKQNTLNSLACYSLYLFPLKHGRLLVWILLRAFESLSIFTQS